MSYGELMDDLSSAWRMKDAPEPPSSDDAYWVHTLHYVFDELEALGLSVPAPKPATKKRGGLRKIRQSRDPRCPEADPGKALFESLYSPANWETLNIS
jgi:hypothetical protein